MLQTHVEHNQTATNTKSKKNQALNDDLLSKFDERINNTDKQLLDCPVNANKASREHYSQYGVRSFVWTI